MPFEQGVLLPTTPYNVSNLQISSNYGSRQTAIPATQLNFAVASGLDSPPTQFDSD